MKYSILVLGASISISLFIRICCSVETNAQYEDKSESGKVFAHIGNNEFGFASEKLRLGLGRDSYANFPKLTPRHNIPRLKHAGLEDSGSVDRADDDKLVAQIKTRGEISSSEDPICAPTTDPPTRPESCAGNCTTVANPMAGCDYNNITKTLTCTDVAITRIPGHAFPNISITKINISNNGINEISPWAFDGVDDLKTLWITNTQLTHLTYNMYVGLDELTIMYLQHNLISWKPYENCSIIEPDKIQLVLPNLALLSLSNNPLEVIPYQMFAGLQNSPLTTLHLENCYLRRIHNDAFQFIEGLRILNLAGNSGIGELTLEFLYPLTNLDTLHLDRTGLSNFPRQALSRLKKLEYLYLSDNEFLSITKADMSELTSLKELKLDNCKIRSINDDAFDDNSELTVISLKNNKLAQVPANFPPLLRELSISRDDNTFTRFNDGFHNLANLRLLELGNIGMETIPNNSVFNEMTSLTRLYLNNCNIRDIEEGAFQNATKLITLFLNRNKISHISPETFRGLDSLKQLNMTDCELTFSSYASTNSTLASPFKQLPKLETLNLSGNKIADLSSKLFQNMSTLKYLNLNNNPIQPWKTRLFPDRILSVYNLSARGDVYTFQVEMSGGEIHSLTDAMIEDFLRITSIDLTGNRFICTASACKLQELINASLPNEESQKWINKENYICFDTSTSTNYQIMTVTEDVCRPKVEEDGGVDPSGDGDQGLLPANSSTVTQLIIIAGSVSLVAVVVILLAYRNRVHLRYFGLK